METLPHAPLPPHAPWLALGASAESAQAGVRDLARAAGFYRVREAPLRVDEGAGLLVPDRKALLREDGTYVANVGHAYQPVDFEDVLSVLLDAAAAAGARPVTAGLYGPRHARMWVLLELPGALRVQGDASPLRRYLLGHAGHDGQAGVTLANVATRVVCQNVLGAALGESGVARWHVAHVGNVRERLEGVRRAMRHLLDGYAHLHALAERLAATRFSEVQLHQAIDRVMPLPDDREAHPRLVGARELVVQLYHAGLGIEGAVRGTAWGALNALVEYFDHHRMTRAVRGRRVEELKLESMWLGRGAALKRAGLQAVLDEAGLALAA